MEHRTLIDGTAYVIASGKTLIDGVDYYIKNGKTVIDETVRELELEVWHKVYLIPWGDGFNYEYAWVKIGDTEYAVDQPTTLLVPDKTYIECNVMGRYAHDSVYGNPEGHIYVNKNLEATATKENVHITYTHIVDSKTCIWLGSITNPEVSGQRSLLDLADDGYILFNYMGPNVDAVIAVDGTTWEEWLGSGVASPLSIVDGQVHMRVTSAMTKPLGYPDGTVVNSKDTILPLRYSVIW